MGGEWDAAPALDAGPGVCGTQLPSTQEAERYALALRGGGKEREEEMWDGEKVVVGEGEEREGEMEEDEEECSSVPPTQLPSTQGSECVHFWPTQGARGLEDKGCVDGYVAFG